jgi:hypothetical protein
VILPVGLFSGLFPAPLLPLSGVQANAKIRVNSGMKNRFIFSSFFERNLFVGHL